VFIARDDPNRAMSFGYELIFETDRLQEFPELGRIVPEYRTNYIREIIFRPYRIVYRVDHERKLCQIARVWHSARGIQQL
jgi:toxin ParE1/3/4